MKNGNQKTCKSKQGLDKKVETKQKKAQTEDNLQRIEASATEEEKTSERRSWMGIVSIVVSCFALVVSIASFFVERYYSNLEYNYKVDPEIDVDGGMGLSIVPEGSDKEVILNASELKIVITKKNNLQDAYRIDKDYCVTKLDLDEMEDVLETGWKDRADGTNPVAPLSA